MFACGRTGRQKRRKRHAAVSRWEIRNISIFITATWKTVEWLHPLQWATQRNRLAWGRLWCGERETEEERKTERENERQRERENQLRLAHEYLDYRPGGRWRINNAFFEFRQTDSRSRFLFFSFSCRRCAGKKKRKRNSFSALMYYFRLWHLVMQFTHETNPSTFPNTVTTFLICIYGTKSKFLSVYGTFL